MSWREMERRRPELRLEVLDAHLTTLRQNSPERRGMMRRVLDLLFASSGIEREVVVRADPLEIFRDLTVPVAKLGDLLALKILSRDDARRPQDRVDLRALFAEANDEDLRLAQASLALIAERGFNRGRNLAALFDAARAEFLR
ncbi:MAG: nucleotidyl transferase AbiEii/AbiGii toxin family protein [Myxococcales bacterium]|nr:nucleotidyl transferase AbiEii/AbiGii toxin family protein [Myxococcales bacterium]